VQGSRHHGTSPASAIGGQDLDRDSSVWNGGIRREFVAEPGGTAAEPPVTMGGGLRRMSTGMEALTMITIFPSMRSSRR
jgi:hypothetical protein